MDEEQVNYVFIEKNQMTSVFEMEHIHNLPQMAYKHFMSYEDEVLYFLMQGKMIGVVSIGDLERFYDRGLCELEINQKYTSANTVDFNYASAFFNRRKSVNEIPIVSDHGELLGCIRKSKEDDLRLEQRKSLKLAKNSKYRWMKLEMLRFINGTKARVVFYSYSSKSLSEAENACLRKRKTREVASKWQLLTNEEWRRFWQSEYEDGIIEIMREERNLYQPVNRNGITVFPDGEGKCFSYQDGNRITPNNPSNANRGIYMFGPCIVAGGYCKDNQTIEAYLQNALENGNADWKVLNRGRCGGRDWYYGQMFVEELSENDIAIIIADERLKLNSDTKGVAFVGDLSDEFSKIPSITDYLIDSVAHCNFIVNKKLAERIYYDLRSTGLLDAPVTMGNPEKLQNYYINWDVYKYFMDFFERYDLKKYPDDVRVGAVIMNCNPFTKGHRYLIERALSMVDELYVFVVEEDKSYFRFEDRFKMVETGVSDLTHIRVIPSGKYILSQDTFAQYFEKEKIETVQSMDYDIYIFGEVVAKMLGICYRFIGEEPFDKVTGKYNETMKRILPDYGVEVIEIPRKTSDKTSMIISATSVRRALKEKNLEVLMELCPASTVSYLKSDYWR